MNMRTNPCERVILKSLRLNAVPMTLEAIITDSEYSTATHVAACVRYLCRASLITAIDNPAAKSKEDRYLYILPPAILAVSAASQELALAR